MEINKQTKQYKKELDEFIDDNENTVEAKFLAVQNYMFADFANNLGKVLDSVLKEFKNINKNLENIANNTEKPVINTTGYAHVEPLRPLKGEWVQEKGGTNTVPKSIPDITYSHANPDIKIKINDDIMMGSVNNNYGIDTKFIGS